MDTSTHPTLIAALTALRGRAVSSVVFVEDYFQIHFDAARISVLTPALVERDGRVATSDGHDFQGVLETFVGARIDSVQKQVNSLILRFAPPMALKVSLQDQPAESEQLIFEDGSGRCWVT